MSAFKDKFSYFFRLGNKVTEWAVIENLTSEKTDSLRDKALIWGAVFLLIKATGAEANKLFILEFDPPLTTGSLTLITAVLTLYYSVQWGKSLWGNVTSFEIRQLADPIQSLESTLQVVTDSLKQNGIPNSHAPKMYAKSLNQAISDYRKELSVLKTRSSMRNLLFWCFDLLPVPVLFLVDMYLFIAE